jgi:demethylspheroidene O-methyltransferase
MAPSSVLPHSAVPWLETLRAGIDRLLTSPRFRHWAAAFPLTRPIARRRTRALFDLCAGFVYSQVLLACVRLDLFEILAAGPQEPVALAHRLGLPPEATQRLLAAAVSLRLVARRPGGRFGLGPLGSAMVGNPGVAAMVEHHALLYADLADPVALLRDRGRETGLGRYWPYATADRPAAVAPEHAVQYSALMAASQPIIAAEVLDAYPFHRHDCLLDVGGGDGTFLAALADRFERPARLLLFDLPAVVAQAAARFATGRLAGRVTPVGGDFFTDALPRGADVATLIRVLHDHDDAAALALLRAIRRALPDQGTLVLAEPMSGTQGAEPVGDAYFGFYLLAMRRGRPRTPAEIGAMLRQAGFSRQRLIATSTPLLVRVIQARP